LIDAGVARPSSALPRRGERADPFLGVTGGSPSYLVGRSARPRGSRACQLLLILVHVAATYPGSVGNVCRGFGNKAYMNAPLERPGDVARRAVAPADTRCSSIPERLCSLHRPATPGLFGHRLRGCGLDRRSIRYSRVRSLASRTKSDCTRPKAVVVGRRPSFVAATLALADLLIFLLHAPNTEPKIHKPEQADPGTSTA